MGTRVLIAVGVVLASGLLVIATKFKSDPRPSAASRPSPVAPAPSRDNVSKQVEERITHLKTVVAKNPSDARSAIELARTLQDAHDLPGALKYYALGLKGDPGRTDARVDYSLCLYQSGKEQEAFEQTELILHRDAENPYALFNLGAIFANRGQPDSASFYWNRLISSHPRDGLSAKAKEDLNQLAAHRPPPI